MKENSDNTMRKRRITLADGRYLIFYTFDGEGASAQDNVSKQARAPEVGQREENSGV